MNKKSKFNLRSFFKNEKQKADNIGVIEIPTERHGGVIKISLDWSYDELGMKTVVFKKYQPRLQAKQTVGIFVAGGASVDKAVREANMKYSMSAKEVMIP